MTTFSSATIEIEFTGGTWTDVTAYYRTPVRLRFGRATRFEDVTAGVMTVRLDNFDGRFMPENFSSPYHPNVAKNKRIRFKVVKSGVTYTRHLGWIQAWEPKFPNGSTNDAYVDITSVDSLGLLALRKLKSNWTEAALYFARSSAFHIDAYEATGEAAGYAALMTNYSPDAGKGQPGWAYVGDWPILQFAKDGDVSCGPVVQVNASTDGKSDKTSAGIQTGSTNIQWLMKCPPSPLDVANQPYCVATFYNNASTALFNLMVNNVGGQNQIAVYNAAGTTNLGTICGLPLGSWVGVEVVQNAGTAANSDFNCCTDLASSGGFFSLANKALDVRNVAAVEFPGGTGAFPNMSVGGVIAYANRAQQAFNQAAVGNPTHTVTGRMTYLAQAVSQLPVTFTQVGDWSALCCLGDWSDRTALDVGSEITRSTRNGTTGSTGVMFGRPRDSQVLAISGGSTRPDAPVATVDIDADMLAGIDMTAAVEGQPTRVAVNSPATRILKIDTAAEAAGEYRLVDVATLNLAGVSDASDTAGFYITRNQGLRFGRVRIDLTGAVSDPTAALFDESGTLTGLFPTAKVRIANLPASHFTYPTRDLFVEGWEEYYGADGVYIMADTSPAQSHQIASDDFSGTNGAGWNGQWVAGQTGTGGTCTIQTNRGRISPGTTATAYTTRRINVTDRADGEITGSMILNNAASKLYAWARADGTLGTDGYVLQMRTSGTVVLERRVASVVTTVATQTLALSAGTQYGWRIRAVGGYVNARVWQWGFAEPSTWTLFYVDPSPISAAGKWGVGAINDGVNATARTVDVDDFLYWDAAADGPNLP